ncbi:MAG TPA: hypothetical protein VHV56_03015 [Pseudolabrys sp.]|jgi:hypothetical protein|nr:hypothetical protein [Pseudolabrys sp.]
MLARQFQETMRVKNAARDAARRQLYTFLRFWKFCGNKQCLRARGCVGNVDGCFKKLWPLVPESTKFTIRSFIKASAPGLSKAQIFAQMARDRQRRDEDAARAREADAQQTPREVPPQTPEIIRSAPRLERNPRLRVL